MRPRHKAAENALQRELEYLATYGFNEAAA